MVSFQIPIGPTQAAIVTFGVSTGTLIVRFRPNYLFSLFFVERPPFGLRASPVITSEVIVGSQEQVRVWH